MKRVVLAAALLFAALPVFASADLTGKWSGSFLITGPDGTQSPDQIYMDLTQKGTELTGEAGPNENQHWAIQKGKVDGTKVTFEVSPQGEGGPTMMFTLSLVEDHLKGSAGAEFQGQKMSAAVDATRVKK